MELEHKLSGPKEEESFAFDLERGAFYFGAFAGNVFFNAVERVGESLNVVEESFGASGGCFEGHGRRLHDGAVGKQGECRAGATRALRMTNASSGEEAV